MSNDLKLALWKARKDGNGAAAIFQYNAEQNQAWLQLMPQQGERKFDSNRRINVKLGDSDIGEMLAVIRGRKAGAGMYNSEKNSWGGLYHKSGQGDDSTIVNFVEDNNGTGYYLNVSAKRGSNTERLGVAVYLGEAAMLEELLSSIAVNIMVEEPYSGNGGGGGGGNRQSRQTEPVGAAAGDSGGYSGSDDDIPF